MSRAYAALIALGLIWGSNFIYMKWATALISPSQVVFLRVLFGFLPLAVMALRAGAITRDQLRHLKEAAFTGYEIIAKVPVILHTPLMSGSNFIHGVVVVGAMIMLGSADTPLQQAIGFFAVALGAANAAGGYVVTERMLAMFKKKDAA